MDGNCVICGQPPESIGVLTTHHRLDGTTIKGFLCDSCYTSHRTGVVMSCTACYFGDENTYEMHEGDGSYDLPDGCPVHGTDANAMTFMLWWEKYRRKEVSVDA